MLQPSLTPALAFIPLVCFSVGSGYRQQHLATANGWNLNDGDSLYVADLDGDGADELVIVSLNGQWVGILKHQDNGLSSDVDRP